MGNLIFAWGDFAPHFFAKSLASPCHTLGASDSCIFPNTSPTIKTSTVLESSFSQLFSDALVYFCAVVFRDAVPT